MQEYCGFLAFLRSHNDVLRDMNTKEEFTDTPSAPAGDNTSLVSTTESPSSHTSRHFCQVRAGCRVKVDFLILMLLISDILISYLLRFPLISIHKP